MFNYIWPIALVVLSNVVYQICAKSVPGDVSPFASVMVTYIVGAIVTAILFFVLNPGHNLVKEFTKMNWSSYALGLAIVGLETGFIYAYKAGWEVSTASIVQSSFLAIALIVVGTLIFHEAMTWNKVVGVFICMIGLIFINWK